MREVYSRALRVIAWLGESTANDDAIFKLVSSAAKSWENHTFSTATEFLSKPYFSRVWIVQEVLLAHVLEVWCGEHRADGDTLSAELLRFIAPSHSFDDHATNIPETARAWESSGRRLLSHRKIWLKAKSQPEFTRSFTLRALVETFGTLQSSDHLDKIYALLGISNDTNQGPNAIHPDYNKRPVEVLLDVLRNQHGKRGPRDAENHEFVDIVRRMLGVSRVALAKLITGRYENIQQHLFVLLEGLSPKIPIRLVDTVNYWSHSYSSDLPSSAVAKPSGCHWHKLDHRPQFDGVLANSTTALMACLAGEIVEADSAGAGEKCNSQHTNIFDAMSGSVMNGAQRCSIAIQADSTATDGSGEAYGTFVGKRGTSGTLFGPSSSVRTGMSIAVLADASQPQAALLLQPSAPNSWSISAVAYLDQAPSPLPNKSVSNSTVSSSRALRQFLNEVYESARGKLSRLPRSLKVESPVTTVCLQYCDTIDLLDLCRCGVLDREQLKKLLEQALQDETLDGPHQCGEDCSTLRVGTTWSN